MRCFPSSLVTEGAADSLELMVDPVRTCNGHVFGRACLRTAMASKKMCPLCRGNVMDVTRDPDKASLLAGVSVQCRFDCKLVSTLDEMLTHELCECKSSP